MSHSHPEYKRPYSFLGIYQPKETLADRSLHYFTQAQPGYQSVTLHHKQSKKPIHMFYQVMDQHEKLCSGVPDTSAILDFEKLKTPVVSNEDELVIDRSKMVKDSEWVKKYEPKEFFDLLSDDKINRNMLNWVMSWNPIVFHKSLKRQTTAPSMFNRTAYSSINNQMSRLGENSYLDAVFSNPKKLILLAGPPGCGKTTLMRVLARKCKYEIVEINASDDRSADKLITKLQNLSSNDTIRENKKPALICLDQIDGVAQSESSGILKVLQYIQNGAQDKKKEKDNKKINKEAQKPIQDTNKAKNQNYPQNKYQQKVQQATKANNTKLNRPIVFICNDPFVRSLKELRSRAHVVYFTELHGERIVKRMRQILQKQKTHIEHQVLQKICEICRNDIRSCLGVLELVVRQKRTNNKNPKDIVNKMKLSFAKDSQSTINDFLLQLFNNKPYNTTNIYTFTKYFQTKILEIDNPSLLSQTFLHNLLHLHSLPNKMGFLTKLFRDLVCDDILQSKSFKNNGELVKYHMLPYLGFSLSFGSQDIRRVQFPSLFFQRLRKIKTNKQIFKTIYSNIPLHLKIFMSKNSVFGPYLLVLYLSMQAGSTKESDVIKCVSLMLSYGFTLKKGGQNGLNYPIFNPEIDLLLTLGTRKPQIFISNTSKSLMEQNYEYFKDKKQLLQNSQLRDNTIALVNQMNLHSRRKRTLAGEGLKYRFAEGTGTKTSSKISISYFF